MSHQNSANPIRLRERAPHAPEVTPIFSAPPGGAEIQGSSVMNNLRSW